MLRRNQQGHFVSKSCRYTIYKRYSTNNDCLIENKIQFPSFTRCRDVQYLILTLGTVCTLYRTEYIINAGVEKWNLLSTYKINFFVKKVVHAHTCIHTYILGFMMCIADLSKGWLNRIYRYVDMMKTYR